MAKRESRVQETRTPSVKTESRGRRDWLSGQRRRLQEERDELRLSIENETEVLKIRSAPDPQEHGDLAEEEREDSVAASTAAVLRSRLAAVEEALRRIEEGAYGRCVDCNRPIPEERLEVLPSATRCTSCQEAVEKRSAKS